MKKLFLLAFMLLSISAVKAQISDVQQKGSWLIVYNENNKEISRMGFSNSDEYLGMGASFYVVRKGSWLIVYDENSKEISRMGFGNSDVFKSAGGNSFNIKKGSWIITYDKNCKELSRRSS